MESFADSDGVEFARYRDLLPRRPRDWPPIDLVRDSVVLADYHYTWKHCQLCGRGRRDGVVLEAHHLIGKWGRSDERTNLLMLCGGHHHDANTSRVPMGLLLWAKWRTDRFNLSWVRLAILRRSHLPDLVVSRIFLDQYNQRVYRGKPSWQTSTHE